MPAKLTGTFSLIAILVSLNGYCADFGAEPGDKRVSWREVSGSGTHFFSTAIIHSVQNTATGLVQRSTDIVELEGDLVGRVLFQPTSDIDFVRGTVINTGNQVFSGSVLGSEPVLLHDDDFRFEVDLGTGATTGEIYLIDHLAGPKVRCLLRMNGTGTTAEGDNTFVYWGRCGTRGLSGLTR